MAKLRTTIVLPEEDIKLIKILAATEGVTMSKIVSRSVRMLRRSGIPKKGGWRSVVGTLNLGGKEPPSRSKIYDRYLKEKFSHR